MSTTSTLYLYSLLYSLHQSINWSCDKMWCNMCVKWTAGSLSYWGQWYRDLCYKSHNYKLIRYALELSNCFLSWKYIAYVWKVNWFVLDLQSGGLMKPCKCKVTMVEICVYAWWPWRPKMYYGFVHHLHAIKIILATTSQQCNH